MQEWPAPHPCTTSRLETPEPRRDRVFIPLGFVLRSFILFFIVVFLLEFEQLFVAFEEEASHRSCCSSEACLSVDFGRQIVLTEFGQ